MASKTWILLLAVLFLICAGVGAFQILHAEEADLVEVWSEGERLYVLRLDTDQVLTVRSQGGENTLTIRDGKIAVTAADCPDHYCMDRGFCAGGFDIVCLPNRLVLRFVGEQEVDGIVG